MKTRLFYLFFIGCFLPIFQYAQPCGITVNAGDDLAVCFPGGPIQLNGSVGGNVLTYSWSPAIGLSDPNILNPIATVTSTTTYTLTAGTFNPSVNLITNGNFESGNVGFTTDYTYSPNDLWPEGTYATLTNPNSAHPNFSPCGDHTTGSGTMMVVNGAANLQDVWCQTVAVTPNTNYAFSAWVASVNPSSPAQLQFSINGMLIGNVFNASPNTCVWQEFFATWNSGGASSALICIVNQNTAASGNDFALDDIGFSPLCEETDDVTIEVVQIFAVANPVVFIDCNENGGAGLQLDGTGSSTGTNITYNWTTFDGNILSGGNTLTPTVNAPGTYTLDVTFNDGFTNCSQQAIVQVVEDPNIPFANAASPFNIDCNNLTVTVLGTGSSEGTEYIYNWTATNGGNILTGETTLTPIVDAAGTYTILVTNTDNGCTAEASVTIVEDTQEPDAQANNPGNLDCLNTTLIVDGFGSSEGTEYDYQWSTNDGNILNGETSLEPEIDQPGTYTILVTNTDNGCTAEAQTTIDEDTAPPDVCISNPEELTCILSEIMLDGTCSNNFGNFTYQWTTSNGNIVSDENTLEPTVNASGTYTLTITNEGNGCTEESPIEVTENVDEPVVDIEIPEVLSCTVTNVVLDGTNSSNANNFTFQWNSSDGNIVSGENTLEPTVNAAGNYTLTITNQDNGCTAEESTEVMGDADLPIADAGTPINLDCLTLNIELDGENSSQGNNFTYQWTTSDGNIVNGEQTLSPEVNAGGTYFLVVTNTNNDCTATSAVTIPQDMDLPIADAGDSSIINCLNLTEILNGENSSQGNEFSYNWTTNDGNIVNGQNTLSPEVDSGGTYVLTITNQNNNCVSEDTVVIGQNLDMPLADAGNPAELNCLTDTLLLSGSNSSIGNEISYEWSTADGNILSGNDSLIVEIDAPGTYQLVVLNTLNGCVDTSEVSISQDIQVPIADAGQTFQLDCNMPVGVLDGESSSQGIEFEYIWTTADGNIVNGDATLVPEVDSEGTYNLLVTNTENGCTATASIEITQDDNIPIAEALVTDQLTCETLDLTIDGSNSTQGSNITFEWTTMDGNFESGQNTLTPSVNEPGTYTLTIFDSNNDCEASTSVVVVQDIELPDVEAGNPFTLTCDDPQFTLDPTGTSTGSNFEFDWQTLDGNFVNPPNSMTPEVDAPGTYTLTITNTENGCVASDEVLISEDMAMPLAEIETPQVLTCAVLTTLLDAQNSSQGSEFSYVWNSQNGNILSGQNSLTPQIDAPGIYNLEITNNSNGCISLESIEVLQDVDYPNVEAGNGAEINCYFPTLNLSGSGSTGAEFSYSWNTQDGNILSGQSSLVPEIDAPGIYELTILNAENDCASTDLVEITQNIENPLAEAGDPFILSCSITSTQLDGAGSEIGNAISYLWTTQNGNILSGNNTLVPEINAPGLYTLTVTNTENGCTESDDVQIQQDANAPTADAGSASPITCAITSISLNGTNSSQGNDFAYNWSTQDGNILSGQNTLIPEVNAPGTYLLTVTNLDNNCETIASVIVDEDTALPFTEAGADSELTCTITSLSLDATGSDQGNQFQYSWTTIDGNILSGQNSLTPEVDAPGTYELNILNTENGCESIDFVTIGQNVTPPNAVAGVGGDLTCIADEVVIFGTGSSTGNDFSYEWNTFNGNISGNINDLMSSANQPGIYEILVTNNINGCTSTAQIEVLQNISPPIASAQVNDILTCVIQTINLDGQNSSQGADFQYSWTTVNGNILSGTNTLNPQIDEPGTYQLMVTNQINGCTSTDDILVDQDINPPIVLIANPEILTCVITEISLDASNSSQGTDFQYTWTTQNGNIIAGGQTLNPEVNSPGTYLLTIQNTENGCTQSSPIGVVEDVELPLANAGDDFVLNCWEDIQFLDGSASQGTSSLSYEWTTSDGALENGINTPNPGISAGGSYQIVVTNSGNGCSHSDFVIVTEDFPFATTEIAQPLCFGDKGHINIANVTGGTSPYLYSIDGENFVSASFFTNLEAGNYNIIVQDVNGCEHAEAQTIIQPQKVEVFVEPEVEVSLGESYQLVTQTSIPTTQITNIQWTPAESLSCNDCLNPIATPTQTTLYNVIIENEHGCKDEAPVLIRVKKDVNIYIPNAFSPNGDGLNDQFYIFAKAEGISKIKSFLIFDRWGETMFEYYDFQPNDPAYGWDGTFRGELLNPAVFVYFAEVEFIDGSIELFEGDVTIAR